MPTDFSHDPFLVALAVLVAIFSSYVGIGLAQRAREARGKLFVAWSLAASVTIGGGIWTLHFIALLSLELPVSQRYDVELTLASALIAMVATSIAFLLVGRREVACVRLWGAGGALGTAIVSMHYVGMAGLRFPGYMIYAWPSFVMAYALAILASTAALWMAFRRMGVIATMLSAAFLGAAIASMHFTSFLGLEVICFSGQPTGEEGMGSRGMALSVAAAIFMLLFMGLVASTFDRRLAEMTSREAHGLRSDRDFIRALLESSPGGVVAFDTGMRVSLWNKSMATMSGLCPDEAIGATIQDLEVWGGDLLAVADRTLAGETMQIEVEMQRGGRLVSVDASPIVSDDGVVQGGLLFVRDESERRRIQEVLRHTQKMEALGQMTGSVAHDFNNLLMVVASSVGLMERTGKVEPYLPSLRDVVERGQGLTRKLLGFARKQDMERITFDPHERLGRTRDLIARTLVPDVKLEMDVDDDLWLVETDPGELEIALINLAVNAKDAMDGSGTMHIAARNVRLPSDVQVTTDELVGDFVEIVVSDTGSGMDETTMANAFDPFFTTKADRGSGLGLSQVYGFARQSGGTASIRSEPGQGTAISLYLPRSAGPLAGVYYDHDGTVLVVEPDPEVSGVTGGMLEQLGCAAEYVGTWREALDRLAAGMACRMILLDAGVVKDGSLESLVAAIRLRAPEIPVVLISGPQRCSVTVDGVVEKPYSIEQIEAVLQNVALLKVEAVA